MLDTIHYTLGDCIDGMKQFPDGFFDLAVVDPPYGDAGGVWSGKERFGGRFDRYRSPVQPLRNVVRPVQESLSGSTTAADRKDIQFCGGGYDLTRTGGTWATKYGKKIIAWDTAPGKEYFDELFRVSRDQIIWGGNYFDLPPTRCFLVWRKLSISENFSMAMCEYAWTSFNDNAKWFECAPQGSANDQRIHPTQKPVRLYEWLLDKYAKPGYKILDTMVGSGSSLIACARMGFEAWGWEIDEDYYRMSTERIERETAQGTLF